MRHAIEELVRTLSSRRALRRRSIPRRRRPHVARSTFTPVCDREPTRTLAV